MASIKQCILDMVDSQTHNVNSTALRAIIHGEIIKCGEGSKVESGELKLSRSWINRLCQQLNLTMRCVTQVAKKIPDDWEAQGEKMLHQLAYLVKMHDLEPEDVFNFDQTACQLNPHAGGRTRAVKGSKDVPRQGADDKRQITVVPVISAAGEKLPLQMIFKGGEGLTGALPNVEVRNRHAGVHFTQTKNHWSTVKTNLALIEHVILRAATASKEARKAVGKTVSDRVLIILDCWPLQKSEDFIKQVKAKFPNVLLLYVPPNLTGKFQPLDVAVNGNFKEHLRNIYGVWAAQSVVEQRESGVAVGNIQLGAKMKERKQVLPDWTVEAWNKVPRQEVMRGWKESGLVKAWDPTVQQAAVERMTTGQLFPVAKGGGIDTQPVPKGVDGPDGSHALEDPYNDDDTYKSDDDEDDEEEGGDETTDEDEDDEGAEKDGGVKLAKGLPATYERAEGSRRVKTPAYLLNKS